MVNELLKNYIEKNIFKEYLKNDKGHSLDHITYVINRSLKFAQNVDNINVDIVYTAAVYHDIGHHIDPKNHEKVSARIMYEDKNLKEFFDEKELTIIKEAIEDHRSSSSKEPRSIYGKILYTADKNNTSINNALTRTYQYRLKHFPNYSLKEIIKDSRKHLIDKFGNNGYATEKIYFEDEEYNKYLKELRNLLENEEEFTKKFIEINNIKI